MAFTYSDHRDLAPGLRQVFGTFTAAAYATNGVAIDLSTYSTSYLSTKCIRAEVTPGNVATAAYHAKVVGFPSTTLATAIKLVLMQPKTTLYDNDDAATDGVAAYIDEDEAAGALLQFVAPSNANVNQREVLIECANALNISSLSWNIVVWGY